MDSDSNDPNLYLKYNPLFNYQEVFKNKYLESYCKDENIRHFCHEIHKKLPNNKVFKLKIIRSCIYNRFQQIKCIYYDFRIINTQITNIEILLRSKDIQKEVYRDFDITFLYVLTNHYNIYPTHSTSPTKVKLNRKKTQRLINFYQLSFSDLIYSTATTLTLTRL